MYWTLLMSWIFGTGLSFLSLKIGTVLIGLLTLPYMYLLGKEVASRRVGLLALILTGVGYWPNLIARIGLRFPLYPMFVAPLLFYLIRGLRTRNRNDFILSGIFLGLGLHGYSPFRIVPLLVVAAFVLYVLHAQSARARWEFVIWLAIAAVTSLLIFLPLLRYATENPDSFSYRALTRLEGIEQPLPGPWLVVFVSNTWNALRMFNWNNGGIWVHSVPDRPALDVVTGALFLAGSTAAPGAIRAKAALAGSFSAGVDPNTLAALDPLTGVSRRESVPESHGGRARARVSDRRPGSGWADHGLWKRQGAGSRWPTG